MNREEGRWKFDFGPGEPALGYEGVGVDCLYNEERGYGFEDVTRVYGRERTAGDSGSTILSRLRRSFCIPLGTAFVVDIPEGTYQVIVLIGDELTETHTLIKTGEGKRVLPLIRTVPGQYIEERFTVAVRGGRLRISISGKAPRINSVEIVPVPQALTLFLVGDSTVTDQPESGYPYAGWGQTIHGFFKHDVCVDNHAVSGRSSRSFIDEGRLNDVLHLLKSGDFLLIQFGHNDEKTDPERGTQPFTTYKEYLRRYIDEAHAKGAHPILVTPVQRRYFNGDGTLSDTHGDYIIAVRELAEECNVALIDLAESTLKLFERAGEEGSKDFFMWVLPGEYINFPSGVQDNTHFQETGAMRVAELVTESIRELQIHPLVMYLRSPSSL